MSLLVCHLRHVSRADAVHLKTFLGPSSDCENYPEYALGDTEQSLNLPSAFNQDSLLSLALHAILARGTSDK